MINDILCAVTIAAFVMAMALLVSGIAAVNRLEGMQVRPLKVKLWRFVCSRRFGTFVETVIAFICITAMMVFINLIN